MIASMAGALLIVWSVAWHHVLLRKLFDCWRESAPREWAHVMRPARRAWPFNTFVRWNIYRWWERQWYYATPEWAIGNARARRLLVRLRFVGVPLVLGFVLVVVALSDYGK